MSALMTPLSGERKRRICYFFDSDIGNYHYGPGHPMKPHRIRMTHALVMNYGLYKKMEIFRAKPATRKEMAQFHTDDYVEFLSKVTPDNMEGFLKEQAKFNLGDDCPVFDGLFEYCSISAGGSMEGAARLSRDKCDIAVNWAGGLHHAKKAEANGFCYVNDIVLGILELLRYHKRVLYVDIDVHHGDGVEEAFYTTDRVMTCSFHKYGEFFPGTGELRDVGSGKGKRYAVNFPLRDGITDEAYKNIFEPVILKIMETYQPSAIVLQCGGDSLAGDRLGSFNVSLRGHANCVQFIKNLGLPLLLLGGGGYTIRNVSRTWAFETGLAAGQELCREIPMNEYYEYFGPTYHLDVPASNMEDMNVQQYLEKVKVQIFENLRHTIPVPSVEMQPIPRLPHDDMEIDEDLDDPNERRPQRLLDALVQRDDEFSDSEDEGEGGRTNNQSQRRPRKVPRTVLDANRSRLASGSLIQQNFAPGPNGTSHAARETRRPLPAAANIVSNGTNGVASADVSMDSNTVALDQSLVVAESNPRGGPLVRDEADRMELETMAANLVEEVNQAVSNSTPATSAVPQQVESAIEERIGMTQTGQPDTNVPQSDEGHKMQIDPPLEVTQEHIPIPIFSDGPSATAPDHSELTKPAPSVEEHDLRPTAKAISVVSSLVSEVEMSDSQSFPSAPSSEPTVNASDRSPQRFSNPHMSLSDVNELQQILDATDTDVGLNTTDPSLQADNARVMMPTEPTNAPLNVGSHNPSERSFGLSGTPQPPQQIPPLSHEAQIPVTSIINPQSSTASNKLVEQPELHSNPTLVDAEQSAARHGNLLTDPHSAKPNLHPLSNDHHQSTRVEQPIVSAVIPGLKILDHLPNAPTASPSINTSQDPLTPQSIAPAILSDHLPPPSPTQSQEAPNRHLVSSNRQITSNAPSSDTTGPTQLSPNWNSSINPSLVPVPPTRLSAGVVPATTITEVPAKAVASQASSQVDMSKGDSRLPWRAMSVEEEMNRMIEQQQRTQMGVSTNDSRNLSSVLTTSGTHPQTNSTGTNATKTESIHPKSSVHHVEPTLTQSSAGPSVIEMDPQLKPMSVSASIHPSITTNPVVSSAPLHVNVPAPMPGTSGDALEAQRGINVAAENTELCTPTIHSGSIDPAIKGSLPTHRGLPQ